MCGIAGLITSNDDPSFITEMIRALRHRGPDDEGFVIRPTVRKGMYVHLGHTRLAVLDPSPAGHQPFASFDKTDWIVYNGEVYNHDTLRHGLPGVFHTNCDTESVLAALKYRGIAAIDSFRGMYAFAWWNEYRQELLLCRDRLGIKPLYYARTPDGFVFASEVRAILATGLVPRQLDLEAVNGYLAFGSVQEPSTIIKGVSLLRAAHWLRIRIPDLEMTARRYWSLSFSGDSRLSYGDAVPRVRQEIQSSVSQRLLSDVPLGVFLSGGIDSSAIIAAMAPESRQATNTFTVDFREDTYGEGRFAREVADYFRTIHREVPVKATDLLSHLPAALDAADQPTVDGVNMHFVCAIARSQGLKVALCGHGGDELFGGYDNFTLLPRVAMLRHLPAWSRPALRLSLSAFVSNRVAVHKGLTVLGQPIDTYTLYSTARSIFWDAARYELLSIPTSFTPARRLVEAALPPSVLADSLTNQLSQLETGIYLRNTLLRDADVFGMAHGVEVRVPLLDHHVAETVAPLPGRYKGPRPQKKRLLVDAFRDVLPSRVYKRKKQGFVIPYERWLRTALRKEVEQVLAAKDLACRAGLNGRVVYDVWQSFCRHNRRVNMQHPWCLFVLLRWCDRNAVSI